MFPSGNPACSHSSPGTPQETLNKSMGNPNQIPGNPPQFTHVLSLPSARVSQQATNIFLPVEEDGEMEQSVAQMMVSTTQHATEMPQVMHIQEPAATFLFSCPHLNLRC